LSEAVALTVTAVPPTTALLTGAVRATVGRVVSGPLVTVKPNVVVRVTLPPVPVTVMVNVPVGVAVVVAMLKVVLQVGEQVAGLNELVAPAGKPEAEKETAVLVPEDKVDVTVFGTDDPLTTDLFPPLLIAKLKGAAWVVAEADVD
jgi:hypothetical protein